MPRAIWKGQLSFGLVMIPVSLYSGTASEAELDMDLIDSRDGGRIRHKRVNEQSGKEVPWASIVKGYQVEPGRYVTLTPADFKAAAADASRGGIEILDFVPRGSISAVYFEKPYYLEPGKNGDKGYALLRETLRRSERVGVARVVIQSRQRLAALLVEGDALILDTMRFSRELREPSELKIPARIKIDPREVELAGRLVEGMSSDWEPEKYEDNYAAALRRLIEEKASAPDGGKRVKARAAEPVTATSDIMDLLRRSVERRGPTRRAAHANHARTRRTHARRAG